MSKMQMIDTTLAHEPEAGTPKPLTCQVCSAPGQLRHAPPPAPASGIWCETCHRRMRIRSGLLHAIHRWRFGIVLAVVALMVWIQSAQAQAPTPAIRIAVGDRVEFTSGGQLERGTVTDLGKLNRDGDAESFYVRHDRTRLPNFVVYTWLHHPRKLAADAAMVHTAPPLRARAPCPEPLAKQGTKPTPALVRALIQCRLEDNTGVYAGTDINTDIVEFKMGQTVRNKETGDPPVRYADPEGWIAHAHVRSNAGSTARVG